VNPGLDLDLDGAALTAQLVDIPSVSGDEGPLADAVESALRSREHLTVHRDGNVIVARTMLGRPQRVILAGHLDTVPLAGNLPSRTERSRLYGCGTTDMKSGVAVQLRLAADVTSPVRDVTYVFYDCEEVAADRNGLLRLSRSNPELLAGDFAVLMEPTTGEIEGGCQGTLRAEITAAGKRAHTARSWMGRNAIHQAGPILDVLRGYTAREPDVDGLRYHEGLNATRSRLLTSSGRCSPAGRCGCSTSRREPGRVWGIRPRPRSSRRSAEPRGPSSAGPTWPGSPDSAFRR
jgi:succinyl-diaminopimelate desuccinylase